MSTRHQNTEDSPVKRRTMTVPQAGAVLGIGRTAAYQAAHTGEIPTIRIGNRIVVPLPAFERMLQQTPTDNR